MTSPMLTTGIAVAFGIALVPAHGLAQTGTLPAPVASAFASGPCPCPAPAPSPAREPAREVGIKLAVLIPFVGPSFSYARNLSESVALEGALDVLTIDDVSGRAGLAVAQVRFSPAGGSASKKFMTAGIARATTFGGRDWLGLEGLGVTVGGGSQHLWTDQAGMRMELQYVRFDEGTLLRMTIGAFFGFGD
jgi:hypothetical protein